MALMFLNCMLIARNPGKYQPFPRPDFARTHGWPGRARKSATSSQTLAFNVRLYKSSLESEETLETAAKNLNGMDSRANPSGFPGKTASDNLAGVQAGADRVKRRQRLK